MSYKSKRTIASLLAATAVAVGYVVYALNVAPATGDNLQAWAIALLVCIGASVVAVIIIQIIFNIVASIGITVKEAGCDDAKAGRLIESTIQDDEMDKLILNKSNYASLVAAGAGFMAALTVLAFGLSAVLALHIIFGSFWIGSFVGSIVSIYYYEAGVSHA
ncbi:MAG: hypothetical protein FWE41_05970 [Coriobacteriia bacterium]|nr:hypothetical protein [Coriobacteriia bacterium]MCL2750630.1 hypothetical protein [Coriobacteriia bacterium]